MKFIKSIKVRKIFSILAITSYVSSFAQTNVYEEKFPIDNEPAKTIIIEENKTIIEVQSNQIYINCTNIVKGDTTYLMYSYCDMGRGGMMYYGIIPKPNTLFAKAIIKKDTVKIYYVNTQFLQQLSKFAHTKLSNLFVISK